LTSEASLGFGIEFLRDALGDDLELPIKVQDGHGTVSEGKVLWRDFCQAAERGEVVYLADVSIPNYFPWLLQHIKVPRYFLHCFSHRTRQRNFAGNKTPSLFIGVKDTLTHLHIDQLCSNFWMFLAEGRKRWITFHPEDAELLSPVLDEKEQISRFPALETLREDADLASKLKRARCLDFVLEEGEVLFIPQGTPHEVYNVTPTVAISSNFFDQSNLEPALRQMERKLAQPSSSEVLKQCHAAMDEMEWPSLEDDLASTSETCLPGSDMVGLFPSHEELQYATPFRFRAP